jgi:hypothetical protein
MPLTFMAEKKIPGIHNYCDRWCERCSFGSKCAVYESEAGVTPEENDLKNKAFWERLSANFAKAHKIIEQMARERGVDLNELAATEQRHERQSEKQREASESHPVATLSVDYMNLTRDWTASQPGVRHKLETIQQQLDLDPKSFAAIKYTTDTIQDSLAVVQWYQTLIHVKFVRALMGKQVDDDDDDQQDHNGSAKVAILAIERSMQAWLKLYELIPEQEDYFLRILALLEKINGLALKEFPHAMAFKRPGFDD